MSGHNVTRETGAIVRDGRRHTENGSTIVAGVRGQWTRNGFAIPARGLGQIASSPEIGNLPNPSHGHGEGPARATGMVDVTCWCDRTVVRATLDDVRAGRTGTCGRPGCGPPA
jgi:hypothetical protein